MLSRLSSRIIYQTFDDIGSNQRIQGQKIVTIQIIFLIFDRHETLHFERVGYAANDMDLYLDLID